DPRVQNAIPHMGFENGSAYYQFIKALIHEVPDVKLDKQHMVIVSPDEGAIHRNLFYASIFGLDLGVFYKVRDYGRIENGRNPIVAHEYIGGDVEGKDVIVVDDILSSGESMLDIGYELKRRKAKRIFSMVTYPLFTNGVEKFDKCYADGAIDKVVSTNLTYRRPELANKPWFVEADMTKYVAKIIDALNYDESLAGLVNPAQRVINLMERVKNGEKI
ncbi:MAG: ribose-phosphate pyrophosphokinase, partial [Clostridia bacterium]|nr:ribose-phosphate pyrophosphokinase [Clostridia bacterium]